MISQFARCAAAAVDLKFRVTDAAREGMLDGGEIASLDWPADAAISRATSVATAAATEVEVKR